MSRAVNLETFGGRLAHAIELAKASRKGLATELKTSVQAIGQAISGKTIAMTAENSARTARYLSVDAFWLATGEGAPRPDRMNFEASLSLQEAELVKAFRMLSEEDQEDIAADVGTRARRAEQIIRRELAKLAPPAGEPKRKPSRAA